MRWRKRRRDPSEHVADLPLSTNGVADLARGAALVHMLRLVWLPAKRTTCQEEVQ
jgi:hypothetical protein